SKLHHPQRVAARAALRYRASLAILALRRLGSRPVRSRTVRATKKAAYAALSSTFVSLERANVRCLHAFGAAGRIVFDALVLLQRLEAAAGDGGEMCEQIVAAALRADETETFLVVEPLHCADGHVLMLLKGLLIKRGRTPPASAQNIRTRRWNQPGGTFCGENRRRNLPVHRTRYMRGGQQQSCFRAKYFLSNPWR